MRHTFTDPKTGRTCMTPWSAEEAIAHGRATFMDSAGCLNCGTDHPKARYVDGGACVGCFLQRELEVFNLWSQGMPGRPEPFCVTAEQADKNGQEWYFGAQIVCESGPHFQRKHIRTGRCIDCESYHARVRAIARGPRAIARSEGRTTYEPVEPCPSCGERSMRNVVTNACLGLCAGPARPRGRPPKGPDQPAASAVKQDGRRTPTSMMVEQFPEMIISREDARRFGYTQYRTGKACQNGHAGWRYVSVGTCVQCARGPK